MTSDVQGYINLDMNFKTVNLSVMVTDLSCNNKLVTTELVVQTVQYRKSQVTYGVTGMKNLRKRKVRSKK